MNNMMLSVVIPSYNEMANLQKGTLEKLAHYFERRKSKLSYEVIVVDDGSDDGSCEFVKQFVKENRGFRLIENNHLGKAGAVTTGVLSSKGDYILFTDMDQATPIEETEKFLPHTHDGYDVIIGSRSSRRRGAPLSRVIMSRSAVILRSILVGLPQIRDTQCGFKMFSKKAARDIFPEIKRIHNGFILIHGSSVTAGFDIELLLLATIHGYKIKEVPVDWLYVESRRVSPIKDSIDGVLDLFKIKMNMMKGVYT